MKTTNELIELARQSGYNEGCYVTLKEFSNRVKANLRFEFILSNEEWKSIDEGIDKIAEKLKGELK